MKVVILLVCLKERLLLSLADLITMATLLSVTPSIKDAFSAAARAEKRGSCFTFSLFSVIHLVQFIELQLLMFVQCYLKCENKSLHQ